MKALNELLQRNPENVSARLRGRARSFTWNKQKTRGCKGYSCQQIRSEPKQTTSTEWREREREKTKKTYGAHICLNPVVKWCAEIKSLRNISFRFRCDDTASSANFQRQTRCKARRVKYGLREMHYKIEAKQRGPCEWLSVRESTEWNRLQFAVQLWIEFGEHQN